jgi:hypothetical protein
MYRRAAARLTFADEWDEAAARRYIAQGTRAIRYHARTATGWDGGDV